MVSEVNIGTAIDQQSKTAGATSKLAEDFTQFLQLLTVQLQNQDPMSPMDTTEFTNQLVAFTGVEQQINTNQKLDALVSLQLGNAMGSALGYVGMDVKYVSSEFNYDGAAPVDISYAFNGEPVSAKIRVLDEDGKVVYEENAERSTGKHEFTWDGTLTAGGTAEPGTYKIALDALDIDDKGVTSTIVVSGRVRGVETQGGALFLLIGDRAVSMGNVLNVSQPPVLPPPAEEQDA
jgi:flagellar basal-body rod modification protein FlgD